MHHASICVATTLALASSLFAAPQGPAPGHRLYGPRGTNDAYLVDNTGTVVHTWTGGTGEPRMVVRMDADGNLLRPEPLAGAPAIAGNGGRIKRIAFDGTVLWDYQLGNSSMWAHIDVEPMPNGNVLVMVWDLMTAQQAINAGRDPATVTSTSWLPDAVVEVEQTGPTTGNIVWEWHIMDHVVQDFDNTKANFGVVANHPELVDINFPARVVADGEWNHFNALSYDPVNDLILVCSLFQEEFYLIDHSTTTAEATGSTGGNYGKGGDILYRWGNPQSYRAGTATDQKLFFPHGAYIVPQGLPGAGNVLCFNNRAGTPMGQNYSAVVEIQLPANFNLTPGMAWGPSGFLWTYTAPTPTNLYSPIMSNPERLPNGNTLVCSGQQAWMFEITNGGQMVWEYFPVVPPPNIVFRANYVSRTLWADQSISASTGGTVDFNLVAGTKFGGQFYLMLGSGAGTSPGFTLNGVNVPLNLDGYTIFTLSNAGTGLPTFFGVLDGMGRATADITFPAVPAIVGLQLHHAFTVIHPITKTIVHASNAVPLTFN